MPRHLHELKKDQSGRVIKINSASPLYNRFIDLGILKDTTITKIGTSPLGDPSAYLIRGAIIAIRDTDCRDILIN